jgi:hypothetical protein
MAQDDLPESPARRIIMRRARGGGFSGGSSTTSESLRAADDHASDEDGEQYDEDDVDQAIDPDDARNRITGNAARSHQEGGSDISEPRRRMNEVQMAGSQAYSKEYRLTLLHRLLMRRVPLDQIANMLKVSVSTIEKDRILLKERLREQARALNIEELIGNQQEVYDEIAGMAMRIAAKEDQPNNPGTPTPMRLAAMRTALAAQADRTRFLNTAGVFDVLRYRRAEDGSDISDVQRLMEKTDGMLERLLESDETETAPRPRRMPRKRAGGFDAFSMDDADASGSGSEIIDI